MDLDQEYHEFRRPRETMTIEESYTESNHTGPRESINFDSEAQVNIRDIRTPSPGIPTNEETQPAANAEPEKAIVTKFDSFYIIDRLYEYNLYLGGNVKEEELEVRKCDPFYQEVDEIKKQFKN